MHHALCNRQDSTTHQPSCKVSKILVSRNMQQHNSADMYKQKYESVGTNMEFGISMIVVVVDQVSEIVTTGVLVSIK